MHGFNKTRIFHLFSLTRDWLLVFESLYRFGITLLFYHESIHSKIIGLVIISSLVLGLVCSSVQFFQSKAGSSF